jgi:hypothetical protein
MAGLTMPDCDAIVVDFSDAIVCTELRVVVIGVGVCLELPNCDENLRDGSNVTTSLYGERTRIAQRFNGTGCSRKYHEHISYMRIGRRR